jgi:D-3-phosphoglycerate dehydrogenase
VTELGGRIDAMKIVVAFPHHADALALLDKRSDIRYEALGRATVAAIEKHLADAGGIALGGTPFGAEALALAPDMRVVSRFGVGYDAVDVAALTARGIPLTIVGEANSTSVAEQTFALMLAAARRVRICDANIRGGGWRDATTEGQFELAGRTVLVVGFGRIGRRVARRCAAFEMRVIVADPYVARELIEGDGHDYVTDLRDAIEDADIVTMHMPGHADGRAEVGAAEFARMKPGALFVNTARGTLVDEAALAAALTDGRVRAAALDVLRDEPPAPDNPLLAFDNVVLSPHCAAFTAESFRRMSMACVQNILDAFDGCLAPEMVVNAEVLDAN